MPFCSQETIAQDINKVKDYMTKCLGDTRQPEPYFTMSEVSYCIVCNCVKSLCSIEKWSKHNHESEAAFIIIIRSDVLTHFHIIFIQKFVDYLFSRGNCVLNEAHLEVYQDMTQPLCHYWIASSHNTYVLIVRFFRHCASYAEEIAFW